MNLLGLIAEFENDLQAAVEYIQKSVDLLRKMDAPEHIWWTIALGWLQYRQGDHKVAKQSVRNSLELVKRSDMARTETAYVFYHVGVFFLEKKPQLAVQFLALAVALRQRLDLFRDPTFDEPYYERFLSAAWAKLGEHEFSGAWEVGLNLRLEEALALALKTVEEL